MMMTHNTANNICERQPSPVLNSQTWTVTQNQKMGVPNSMVPKVVETAPGVVSTWALFVQRGAGGLLPLGATDKVPEYHSHSPIVASRAVPFIVCPCNPTLRALFCAQTYVCLASARSDGPGQADSQNTTYFVPCETQLACRLLRWNVCLDSVFVLLDFQSARRLPSGWKCYESPHVRSWSLVSLRSDHVKPPQGKRVDRAAHFISAG